MSLILSGLIVCDIFFVYESRRLRKVAVDKSRIATIFVLLLTSVGPLLQCLSVIAPGVLNRTVAGTNIGAVFQALVLALASFIVFTTKIKDSKSNALSMPIVFLGIYVFWAITNSLLLNQSWFGALSLAPLIVAISIGNFNEKEIELGLWLSISIIALATTFTIAGYRVLMPCRPDKCMIIKETLDFNGTQNGFSISIALIGLILMYLTKVMRLRIALFVTIAFFVILGGSRSAFFTFLFIGLGLLISLRSTESKISKALPLIISILAVTLSLYPIFANFSDQSLTLRGVLWRNAKIAILNNPIIGNGPSYWTHQFSTGGFTANYGTHNIWLDNLVAFGFIGLILFVIITGSLYTSAHNSDLSILISTIFTLGAIESSFQIWKLSGGVPFFIIIILLHKIIARTIKSEKSVE